MVVNDEDEDSNTPLHLACLAGHAKVVRTLIEAGADIEARNCTLWTPLDCAAARGWLKTVRVLLEADAPVDPLDRSKVPFVNILPRRHKTDRCFQRLTSIHGDTPPLEKKNNQKHL